MNIYFKAIIGLGFMLFISSASADDSRFISAVIDGNIQEVRKLMREGANPDAKVKELNNSPVLLVPLSSKNDNMTITLLKGGANPNFIISKQGVTFSPLHMAISLKNNTLIKALLEAGASLDAIDNEGSTPLIHAAKHNQIEVVKYLLSKGAPVDAIDLKGRTSLHWASVLGYTKTVNILVLNGANMSAKTHDGHTPLSAAKINKHTEVINYLNRAGVTK